MLLSNLFILPPVHYTRFFDFCELKKMNYAIMTPLYTFTVCVSTGVSAGAGAGAKAGLFNVV